MMITNKSRYTSNSKKKKSKNFYSLKQDKRSNLWSNIIVFPMINWLISTKYFMMLYLRNDYLKTKSVLDNSTNRILSTKMTSIVLQSINQKLNNKLSFMRVNLCIGEKLLIAILNIMIILHHYREASMTWY